MVEENRKTDRKTDRKIDSWKSRVERQRQTSHEAVVVIVAEAEQDEG